MRHGIQHGSKYNAGTTLQRSPIPVIGAPGVAAMTAACIAITGASVTRAGSIIRAAAIAVSRRCRRWPSRAPITIVGICTQEFTNGANVSGSAARVQGVLPCRAMPPEP